MLSRRGNGTGFWNFNRFAALFPMVQTTLSVAASVRKLLVVFTMQTQLGQTIVCEISNDQAQKMLLSKVDLLQTALSIKMAGVRAKEMKGGESSILRVSSICYYCEKPGHESKLCRYKEAKCHKCGKVGHILPACRSKDKRKKIPAGQGQQKQKKSRSRQDQSDTMKWVEVIHSSAPLYRWRWTLVQRFLYV